jgi:hypothetical protein
MLPPCNRARTATMLACPMLSRTTSGLAPLTQHEAGVHGAEAPKIYGLCLQPGSPKYLRILLSQRGMLVTCSAENGRQPFKFDLAVHNAAVRIHGISIHGGDSFLDGQAAMHWKVLRIVPVVNASGPDITRSAAGGVNIESIWLPGCEPKSLLPGERQYRSSRRRNLRYPCLSERSRYC